jgi:hypothetical protein
MYTVKVSAPYPLGFPVLTFSNKWSVMQYVVVRPGMTVPAIPWRAHAHSRGLRSSQYRGNYLPALQCVVRVFVVEHPLCIVISKFDRFLFRQVQ